MRRIFFVQANLVLAIAFSVSLAGTAACGASENKGKSPKAEKAAERARAQMQRPKPVEKEKAKRSDKNIFGKNSVGKNGVGKSKDDGDDDDLDDLPSVTRRRLQRSKGEAIQWVKLPEDLYLCTRHGPDWTIEETEGKSGDDDATPLYKPPFVLSVALGMKIDFQIKARALRSRISSYELEGLPFGASFDGKTGVFKWTVVGKHKQVFPMKLWAKAKNGTKASWSMKIAIVDAMTAQVWKWGVGNKEPDCPRKRGIRFWIEGDLNGDGTKDICYGVEESRLDGSDRPAQSFFLKLNRKGKGYRTLDLSDIAPSPVTRMALYRTVNNVVLLFFENNCCCTHIFKFLRVKGLKVESAGRMVADGTCKDERIRLDLITDRRKRLVGVRKTGPKSKTIYKWKKDEFVE